MQTTLIVGVLAALAAFAHAQCASPYHWPVPTRWPESHYHREIMFTDKYYSDKKVAFSFPTRQMRYDSTYLSGPTTFSSIINLTSLWINDTLYIYTFETGAGRIVPPNCVSLKMGFGMMRPDWFQDGNQSGLVWQSKKSDFYDPNYHRVLMTVKDAGQGTPEQDEVFTYYSYFDNGKEPGTENGAPFLMHAPSPSGMVVNEYYEFEARDYGASNPIFQVPIPGGPRCIPAGFAATHHEAYALLQKHGVATTHHVEIALGALSTMHLPPNSRF